MLYILNCIFDDKFVDGIINSFDLTSTYCHHDYVIIGDGLTKQFKYIKQSDKIHLVNRSNFISLLNEGNYDAIIIHGLKQEMIDLLLQIDKKIVIIWKAWGFDIYTSPHVYASFIRLQLYKPLTKKAIRKKASYYLREVHGYLHYLKRLNIIHKAISRIDFFSGVLHCEYDLMSRLEYFKAGEVYLPYISLKENTLHTTNNHDNILIGNSNDPSNNHLDAFNYLKFVNIGDRKIYCPLSYGGTDIYREKVIEAGKQYWGDNFIPLIELLPEQEYMKIIDSCEIAIFYHERQQAIGNITHVLRNGCSVYLSPTSINYKELSNIGFKVFDITQDLESLLTLNDREKINNKELCEKTASKQSFIESVFDMYDKISNKRNMFFD